MQSCNSQSKNNIEKEKSSESKKFDLANLALNENIYNLLATINLSEKDTIKSDEITLIGNQRLVFNSEEVLIFNTTKLNNKIGLNKNTVTFHYGKIDPNIGALNNEKNNIIGMYQIKLNSAPEAQNLVQNLDSKLGKAFFENERNGNESEIKDNNLIETSNKFKEKIKIWKDKTMIYYIFEQTTSNNKQISNISLNLFVFSKNNKEWLSLISGLGYTDTEKCLD